MLSRIKKLIYLLPCIVLFGACMKQNGFGPNYAAYNPGDNPIVVTNATDYRPDPTVTTSLTTDNSITITLALTSSKGRSMKEVTSVIGSTSYSAIQNPSSKFYNSAPIPATNNSATFTTSLTEYFQKYPVSPANPKATANVELANRFYFKVTLDDGSVVYPTPVRVLVLP